MSAQPSSLPHTTRLGISSTSGYKEIGIPLTLLQKLEGLNFAHDLILLSQKVAHQQQNFQLLQEQAARVRLKVNAINTKEMRIWPTSNTGNINCAGEILEQVTVFTYLGSLIITTEEDVEARCRKGQAAFYMVRPIERSKFIALRIKIRTFNSNMKLFLLHGAETLRLTKEIIALRQTLTKAKLQYILGVCWPSKTSNDGLWQCKK